MILNEKQAIIWKTGQKTGKQENLQKKPGKNRKTCSVGTLQHCFLRSHLFCNLCIVYHGNLHKPQHNLVHWHEKNNCYHHGFLDVKRQLQRITFNNSSGAGDSSVMIGTKLFSSNNSTPIFGIWFAFLQSVPFLHLEVNAKSMKVSRSFWWRQTSWFDRRRT